MWLIIKSFNCELEPEREREMRREEREREEREDKKDKEDKE